MNIPSAFSRLTPDEIAECHPVSDETYRELWAILVNPEFKPRKESEIPDDFSGSLKDAWHLLSDGAKADIIAIAK